MMNIIKKFSFLILLALMVTSLSSCKFVKRIFNPTIETPTSTKYLKEFHDINFIQIQDKLTEDALALYVDYSTCISEGMKSPFYQALVPSWENASKSYFSIKGDTIKQEDLAKNRVYDLLLNVHEVNFADLRSAASMIADGKTEAALLTDGEYYRPNIAGASPMDPYLANAFKKWMQHGHDIFIISEPYKELYKGGYFDKKRFYILFTDSRIPNNIYDRICETTKLQQFPDVEVFHLSADHPSVLSAGNSSEVNPNLAASIQPFGTMEIQDWTVTWDIITNTIVSAVNPQNGQPLQDGDYVIKGLKVDRNSFGGYKIKSVKAIAYDINPEFADFDAIKSSDGKIGPIGNPLTELPDIFKINKNEFDRHGFIELHFNPMAFTTGYFTGSPFNYMKIDFVISETETVIDRYSRMFEFEVLGQKGKINNSVLASVKQCLTDPQLKEQIMRAPFYTIYVKSNEN